MAMSFCADLLDRLCQPDDGLVHSVHQCEAAGCPIATRPVSRGNPRKRASHSRSGLAGTPANAEASNSRAAASANAAAACCAHSMPPLLTNNLMEPQHLARQAALARPRQEAAYPRAVRAIGVAKRVREQKGPFALPEIAVDLLAVSRNVSR